MKTKIKIYFLYFLVIFLALIVNISSKITEEEPEELIDPTTLPKKDDPNILYIPIVHTNDIHGTFFPKETLLPSGQKYSIGGLEYLGKFITTLYEEWGDQLVYLDGGDEFQGGIEGYISKGQIIMDYLKELKVKNAAIGNHEFDFGFEFLKEYMNTSNFQFLAANVFNKTSKSYETFPHQQRTIIQEVNGIKIGIIGLATVETPDASATNFDELVFEDYIKIINEESEKLKKAGANVIVLLAHLGLKCYDLDEIKYQYLLRDKNTPQGICNPKDEATILLNQLDPSVVDIVLSGHKHQVSHHWINGIPVVSNDLNGKYADIVYLPFDRKTKKLINEKIQMEGPLPICEKIFVNKKICDLIALNDTQEQEYGSLVSYKFHGVKIEKEKTISQIAEKYKDIYNEFHKDILTLTHDHFESTKDKENNLGNLYTDFLRHISGADISIINPGAFRTPLYRGNISNASIYSFDPFSNQIVKFKAYGWEVKKMFKQLQNGTSGFYPTSGLRSIVNNLPFKKLVSIKLYDGREESEIKDNALYGMVSSEFCFPIEEGKSGGDDFKAVYKWFKPREASYVNVGGFNDTRNIFIQYLRNIDELKSIKYYNKFNLRMRVSNMTEG